MNDSLKTKIDGVLSSGKVVLFMKARPLCQCVASQRAP